MSKLNRQKLARIISDIFIPPTFSFFMSIYLPIILTEGKKQFLINFLVMFLSTVFLPILYFIYKRRKGEIINRDAVIKEERTDVYRFGLILFSLAYIFVVIIKANIFIQIYFLNYTLSTFGVLLINKKFKISIHSMTPAGVSALLLFIDPLLASFVLIIMFLVMWSRLELKVHTLKEVLSGMIYGFSVTLFVTILVLAYAT